MFFVFPLRYFLWKILIFFVETTFFIMSLNLPSLKSSGCIYRVSRMVAVAAFPLSAIFSISAFEFNLDLIFLQHYQLSFLTVVSSLLTDCFILISNFVNATWPITVRQRVSRTTGFAVCDELNNRCMVTNH